MSDPLVAEAVIPEEHYKSGQIDIIDFQNSPDGEYKWLLLYQDISTTFCFLRPLKTKNAEEVAIEVLKIFLEVGCPYILKSNSGREFTVSIIERLAILWPTIKIICGSVRYSQDSKQCSMEYIETMVLTWMADNKSTSWSLGCYFVQLRWNTCNFTNGKTPFKAFFGVNPTLGLSYTSLPKDVISQLESEDDLKRALKNIGEHQKAELIKEPTEKIINLNTSIDIFCDEITHITKSEESEEIEIKLEPLPTIHDPTSDPLSFETVIKKEEFLENDNQEVESDILPDNDTDKKIEQILICSICGKETSILQRCVSCKKIIHAMCSIVTKNEEGYLPNLLCNHCVTERDGQSNQLQISLKRPKNAKAASSKKFKESKVHIPVLNEARTANGTLDNGNVTENGFEKNNLHIVETSADIVNNIVPRNKVNSRPGAIDKERVKKINIQSRSSALRERPERRRPGASQANISNEAKANIVALYSDGLNISQISKETGLCRETIRRWVKRFKEEGSLKSRERSGRPRLISQPQRRYMVAEYETNGAIPTRRFADEFGTSARTVRRTLHAEGLHTERQLKNRNATA